ncbi:MAG: hypothetical protein ACXVHD_30265 [Solirubrobacteraceae bacterium]
MANRFTSMPDCAKVGFLPDGTLDLEEGIAPGGHQPRQIGRVQVVCSG